MAGFISLATDLGAQCIELDGRWLTAVPASELAHLGAELKAAGRAVIASDWLSQVAGETLAGPIRCAAALGASVLRLHLTPVLEGARASCGARWSAMVAHARATLEQAARTAADHGLRLAIENHQDFTSEELLEMAASAPGVGLVLDTGNPFAVGEDPLAFVRRAGDRICHVHLKDYVAQFTPDGYRLVRCAIGDGCVPFAALAAALPHGVTASLEPGALEARHIRLFRPEWWRGYPPRAASELATALGRLQEHRLRDDEEWRTPWERQEPGTAIAAYELGQLHRSVVNVRAMGWL